MSLNSNVKKPGQEFEWEPHIIKELIKCKNNLEYFATTYVKVAHQEYGVIPMQPREYQIDIWNKLINYNRNIILMSRQSGKSASVSAYVLWFAIFNEDKNIGIVSNKETAAKSFLMRIKDCFQRLPSWIKPGVEKWAETFIRFENGTQIQISATSADSFRGEPLALLVADEFAAVDPPWKAKQFYASVYPTVSASKTAKVIIISTAKGMHNQFYDIWNKAVNKKNTYIPTKYDWRVVPGRTKEWAEEEKKNIGDVAFAQEYDCEFIGSTNTVLKTATLERLMEQDHPTPLLIELNDNFRIYKKPESGYTYILGVDVSKGTGLDYSVIQVIKVNNFNPLDLEQVAVYECNTINPYSFAEIVNRIAIYYNNAYISVENNGEGSVIVSEIWWNYENENLVNEGTKISKLGIRATTKTKPKAVILMKRLIEDNSLKIVDVKTINQFTDFQDLGNNRFACLNMHDDLISALYWSVYTFELNYFDEDFKMKALETFDDDEGWGILADVEIPEEDFSWVHA